MPWVPIKSVDKHIYSAIMKMDAGHIMSIKSFKKDRIVTVRKVSDKFQIDEDGFRNTQIIVDNQSLKRTMKDIIELEYPRSHRVMVSEQEIK
ncbi:MAG: hypothetical protein QXZ44_07375 [Ferroplasma sp.]